MKILFLDMDGVVNSSSGDVLWFEKYHESNPSEYYSPAYDAYNTEFNNGLEIVYPENAKHVLRICNETGCKAVWSSTWRNHPYYSDISTADEMLQRRNVIPPNTLIGYTPVIFDASRSEEISAWISENYDNENMPVMVAIDDLEIGHISGVNIFTTDPDTGITEEIASEIINYFNESK